MWNRGAYLLILSVLALLVLGMMAPARWDPFGPRAYEPASLRARGPGRDDYVVRAAFAEGQLWLMSGAGGLWAVDEDGQKARKEVLSEPVHDLCTQAGALVLATGPRNGAVVWTIQTLKGGHWSRFASVKTRDEALIGLHCGSDGVSLLTTWRLIRLQGAHSVIVRLSDPTPHVGFSTFFETPTHLFVGLNVGEWGGRPSSDR